MSIIKNEFTWKLPKDIDALFVISIKQFGIIFIW